MSRVSSDYQVAGATGICASSGQQLAEGDPCIATLVERELDEGFDRQDFSVDAWQSGARPERLFSFWKTVVPSKEQKKSLLVDDAVLMDLFERLAADERPQRQAFRFVLGLILMRKRLLRYVGSKRDEQPDVPAVTSNGDSAEAVESPRDIPRDGPEERWLLKPRGSDADAPPLELINPRLSDDDVRELTEQLSEILQGEL